MHISIFKDRGQSPVASALLRRSSLNSIAVTGVQSRSRTVHFALLGSHIAVVAGIIGVVGLSYRAPVEASATQVQAATALQQPVVSVDQIAAASVATTAAQYANLPIQSSVQSLSDSLNAKTAAAQTDTNFVNKPQIVQQSDRKEIISYTTKAGDTVQTVAAAYSISEDTVRWANNLTSDALAPGKSLTILPVTGIRYTVKAGDTADSLAAKYKADPDRIIAINDDELSGVVPGQQIIIPDGILPDSERPGFVAQRLGFNVGVRMTVFAGNTYAFGNCTYYAFNRRAELGHPVGSNWGNAITWAIYAAQGGWHVDKNPAPGDVFQTNSGWQGLGHVGIVERVNADGSIEVSEMNYNGWNVISGGPHAQRPARIISKDQIASYNFIHDRN